MAAGWLCIMSKRALQATGPTGSVVIDPNPVAVTATAAAETDSGARARICTLSQRILNLSVAFSFTDDSRSLLKHGYGQNEAQQCGQFINYYYYAFVYTNQRLNATNGELH